jgi:glycosyltransferase involved in cell wall biosynthesis
MISIGMLAYNEAHNIERTIRSLFDQSLFAAGQAGPAIEFIVVANGCSDKTAAIAQSVIDEATATPGLRHVTARVEELGRPGKCHAWNRYVHDFAAQHADTVILVDADIEFLTPTTLESMVRLLDERPEVWVAVDEPVKDVNLASGGGLMQRLSARIGSLRAGRARPGAPSWLCGQCYCMRGDLIRRLRLPSDWTGPQDSLLYDLVVTDCLREEPRPERVVTAPDAAHRFEAYTTARSLLRHERWLISGAIVNGFVIYDLQREVREKGSDAASIIAWRDANEPGWVGRLVAEVVDTQGRWLVPRHILLRRYNALARMAWPRRLLFGPLAGAAFVADFVAAFGANAELRRRRTVAVSGKR